MQLGGHGEGREVVTANQLGMPPDESRAPGEGHQQNQGDRRQTLVGDPFSLSGSVAAFGVVAASMEEALLESPMRMSSAATGRPTPPRFRPLSGPASPG